MTIPTSFVIPKDYFRFFYFEDTETGFKHIIIAEEGKLHIGGQGKATPLATSRCLDWCQESIEQVRYDVGADEQDTPLPGDDAEPVI
jgi:hypothetical protein